MADPTRGESQFSAVLPEKEFLTEAELLEIWETRGLKYRVDEFWKHCQDKGLFPHFRREVFRKKVFGMLKAFFVEGDVRRDPRWVPPPRRRKVV